MIYLLLLTVILISISIGISKIQEARLNSLFRRLALLSNKIDSITDDYYVQSNSKHNYLVDKLNEIQQENESKICGEQLG